LRDLAAVAGGAPASLARGAIETMRAAHEVVLELAAAGTPVYGLTTGVAERKRATVESASAGAVSRRLVRNHLIAQGAPASPALVRATICCLANGFATGYPGVRPELAAFLLEALNEGRLPVVRTLGSVGEADLGPLADLAEGLLAGSGFELEAGEGLALLDSNAFSTAGAALALGDTGLLLGWLHGAAALDLEAYGANLSVLHEVVAASRPHPGLAEARSELAGLLHGSFLHQSTSPRNLQDPLSFRCLPQLHGAVLDAFGYARRVVETECNAAQGNPLVVAGERRAISVGNFEAVHVSAALDFVRIALAPVLTAATERSVKLLQATSSGLSPGLSSTPEDGDDGLAELAVASQAITIEARLLAQPVSFELASTSKAEGIEDRTSMAPLSARRLAEMTVLGARTLAIGLAVAAQALDLRPGPPGVVAERLGSGTAPLYRRVRQLVSFTGPGDSLPADLEPLVGAICEEMLYARPPSARGPGDASATGEAADWRRAGRGDG
jgi:histidine ammonia-lyase